MVTWAEEAALPEGGAAPTGTLGTGLTKARPVFPQVVIIPALPGGAEVGGPRSGSCWNWPQAWKPLKAFEETGRTSGLKNKTIRLPMRCWTQLLPQAALITEMAGRGEWREHPVWPASLGGPGLRSLPCGPAGRSPSVALHSPTMLSVLLPLLKY